MRLDNKIIIVTGGGSGIGKACAKTFNREGAHVVMADVNKENLNSSIENLDPHRKSLKFICDVSSKKDAKNLIDFTIDSLGKVDILVNCAGVNPRNAPEQYDFEEVWDWVVGVNLKGSFLMSHFAVEKMKESGGGVILNIASIIGLVGYDEKISSGLSSYAHSKGGVVQLTRDMAVGYAKSNIRVNSLCPGYAKTKLTEQLFKDDKILNHMKSLHPMGRLAELNEIANAALFLCSDEASFITGVNLPVDGGYTAR